MQGVLTAETAILVELKTIGIVLLVLERIVVPLLAFGAGKCDLYAHGCYLLKDCGSIGRFLRPSAYSAVHKYKLNNTPLQGLYHFNTCFDVCQAESRLF